MNPNLAEKLDAARSSNDLLPASFDNIAELLGGSSNLQYESAIAELANAGEWDELNNRFFQKLTFGTGGIRGRCIGGVITASEQGDAAPGDRPQFPCVGTNALNFYNITRATLGLVRFLLKFQDGDKRPSIALARDTRHFGKEFADCVVRIVTEHGCDVYVFAEPRSTPQLSFAVRHYRTTAGIVLTASHNPPHDNGFKVYGDDGAQIVEPAASMIIAEVNAVSSEGYDPLPPEQQGKVHRLGPQDDENYMASLETLLINPDIVKEQDDLKIVFTSIHGTGGTISPGMLRRLGFQCDTVAAQDEQNGWFPTVQSPNPENAEALSMAIQQAEESGSDIVIGTDPDGDRMAVAVRDSAGKMALLTGNQIGSLMAWYRTKTLFEQGVLNSANRDHAVIIKTLVTTELQTAVAAKFGVPVVNTLTGFKYIAAKLRKYENQIPVGLRTDYRNLTSEETRGLRLEFSRFFVFGGEESYGYLGADFVRDKDGNGAVVMFAELAAYAKSQNLTCVDLLNRLFCVHGVFKEGQHAETLSGAEGKDRIQSLAASYVEQPPAEIDGVKVRRVRDFANEDHYDEEGDVIPREKMAFFDLADGRAFAVRPSGTEPKIKFYLYYRPAPGLDPVIAMEALDAAKAEADAKHESLRQWILEDMRRRLEAI